MDIKSKYSELITGSCDSTEGLNSYLKAFVLLGYSLEEDLISPEKLTEIENFINNL